jgi:site-specific recombinase XerD
MPLKGGYVTKRFKQYIRRAGLSEQFHWHHLRATFASYLVQSSTPLAEVQRLLGHSSVVTTQIYAVVSDDNLRNAADKIHLDEFTPKGLLQ